MNDQCRFIYLHGFASGPASYKASFFKEKIKNEFHFDISCPDLNQPDFFNLNLSAQINYVEKQYDMCSPILIGSSLGAYLSLLLAQRNRIKIKALVLLAPAFDIIERRLKLMQTDEYKKWQNLNEIDVFHHYYQKTMKLSYNFIEDAKKHKFDSSKIKIPILLFHGVNDQVVDYHLSKKYLATYHNLEAHYPESDHLLIDQLDLIWEKTQRLINKFI